MLGPVSRRRQPNRKPRAAKSRALVPPKKPGEPEFPTAGNPFGLWFPEPGDDLSPPYPVPNLSEEDFAPNLPGYRRVDTLHVDAGGFAPSGAELTHEQFAAYVREQLATGKHLGYGITDVDHRQFTSSVYISAYEPLPRKRRGKGRVSPADLAKLAKRVSDLRARTVERGASPAEADTAAQILRGAEAKLVDARARVDPDIGPELSPKDLRDVLRRRLARAVEQHHGDCEDQSCDISVAAGRGLTLWAADLLIGRGARCRRRVSDLRFSSTECDEVERLYAQLAPTEAELDVERVELLAIPHVSCEECETITWEVDDWRPETCGNCLAAISWGDEEKEDEDGEVEVDESECARCGTRLFTTPRHFVVDVHHDERPVCSQACAAASRDEPVPAPENQLAFDFTKK